MRKTAVYTLIFIVLTLSVTQLASAQWRTNTVTNQTTETIFVVWSTAYPAVGDVPEAGYRTSGWINLQPGQQEGFWGYANHRVYFLILKGGDPIKPSLSTNTLSSWVNRGANFNIVAPKEINDPTPSGDIVYSNTSVNDLTRQDGFIRYENDSTINVTSSWVSVPEGLMEDIPDEPPPNVSELTASPLAEEVFRKFHNALTESGVRKAFSDILVAFKRPELHATLTTNQDVIDALDVEVVRNTFRINNQYQVVMTKNNKLLRDPDVLELLRTPAQIDTLLAVLGNSVSFNQLQNHFREPGRILISPSSPGDKDPGVSIPLTITVYQRDGELYIRERTVAQQSVILTVNSPGSFDRGGTVENSGRKLTSTVNAQGKVSTTLKTQKTTPRKASGTQTYTVTATIGKDVETKSTYRARWIPYRIAISSSRDDDRNRSGTQITSGNTSTITATLTARGGQALQGYTLRFHDSPDDKEIAFSKTGSSSKSDDVSVSTNSSGKASVILRTGSSGEAAFDVKTSGVSPKTFSLTVKDRIKQTSVSRTFASRKQCKGVIFPPFLVRDGDFYTTTKTFSFPGTVVSRQVSADVDFEDNPYVDQERSERDHSISGSSVKVVVRFKPWCWNQTTVDITVRASYIDNASSPGAPSLQPQLRPEVDQLSSVWEDLSQVPLETALLPNYPNPFNPETWIPYHLAEPADVTLSIYAADGRLVRTLTLGHQAAGVYENKSRAAYWDGRNAVGERVASGLYFYTLTAGNFAATGKMLIMK